MAANDQVKSGDGASATDVFGTVPKEPEPETAQKPKPAPVEPVPALNASSGGFTQLLRALNYDAVKETPAVVPPAGKVVATAVGGPMTQLLRTISATEPDVAEKPLPSGSAQVTSFLPQTAPAMPSAAAVAPAAPVQEAGSFTQLLQKPKVGPTSLENAEEPAAPVSFTQLFASSGPDTERKDEAVQATAPGSFTQMFQTLSEPAMSPAPPVAEPSPAAAPEVKRNASQVVPAGVPGSFTQMFQTLNAPEGEPAPHPVARIETPSVAAVEPAVNMPKAADASPGSFTQIFQVLDTPAVEPDRHDVTPMRAEAAGAAAAPGSFTQLFGGITSSSAPVIPPAPSSYERPFAASGPVREPEREESGASQMFATYREPQAAPAERRPEFSPEAFAPVGGAPASTPSSGGLTQLLRALDGPTPATKPYAAPSYSPPVAPTLPPGSFTGVYGELGTPTAATPLGVAPAAAPTPAAAGPSEFTRLINASALREAALRGGGEVAAASHPAAAAPASSAGFAMPGGLPAGVPHPSFAAPAAPQASIAGPGGTHAAVSAAGGGQASFTAPTIPAAPQVKMPEVSKAGNAPAGIQKYVPLLLILVIFLLLAILVAVVVLMKK